MQPVMKDHHQEADEENVRLNEDGRGSSCRDERAGSSPRRGEGTLEKRGGGSHEKETRLRARLTGLMERLSKQLR